MPPQAWFESKAAPTAEAVAAGDGCHPDEAQALADYLNGAVSIHEAAKRITSPILAEADPPQETYRLWGLLCEALVELNDEERHKTLDLLSAIQSLPSSSALAWSRLTGFASMWDTLYRLHLHGPDGWEGELETLSDDRKSRLRRFFSSVGTAEAEMFVRGFSTVVEADWGFKVLNLACSERRGVEIFLNEIYAWLKVAGFKLQGDLKPEHQGESDEWKTGNTTTTKHWLRWEKALSDLSKQDGKLSEEGRMLAAQCYDCM